MRILGLIPARGGSKGVPRKNIRILGGKPLLLYTAEAALASRLLSRVVLSTEDEDIATVGRQCGIEVPFLRPRELAEDHTPMLPVVQQAVAYLEDAGDHFDAICLLQPTNPFRQSQDIDGCIEKLIESEADSVVAMLRVPAEYNPHWVYFEDVKGMLKISTGESTPITRRQELPDAYHREGSVYVVQRDVLMKQNSLYGERTAGYVLDPARSVNIDNWEDWERAEALLVGEPR